jgi:hypothetical protein
LWFSYIVFSPSLIFRVPFQEGFLALNPTAFRGKAAGLTAKFSALKMGKRRKRKPKLPFSARFFAITF